MAYPPYPNFQSCTAWMGGCEQNWAFISPLLALLFSWRLNFERGDGGRPLTYDTCWMGVYFANTGNNNHHLMTKKWESSFTSSPHRHSHFGSNMARPICPLCSIQLSSLTLSLQSKWACEEELKWMRSAGLAYFVLCESCHSHVWPHDIRCRGVELSSMRLHDPCRERRSCSFSGWRLLHWLPWTELS